jgi:BirA family biotin operon repressor/biotin-[acetyl-CoA-carboxylase] ligase
MHEIHLDTIDSTNTYAKKHAATFPKDQITCVTAEEQTAGRGRFQRSWVSPKGVNLYITFYFRLPAQTKDLISLAQIMACSCAAVLCNEGLDPKIKWPNDIQINGKKLGGILCETVFLGEKVDIFLGIGVNVNTDADFFAKIDQPATSLKAETGREWDRLPLLKKIQTQFAYDLERFKKQGFFPFHDFLENLLAYRGEKICCFDGKQKWVGICHSLSSDGQLNLLLEDHTIHTVVSGELRDFRQP